MENSYTLKIWEYICKHKYIIAIIGIMLLASLLRFSGYNFDNLYKIHPDERALLYASMRIDFFQGLLDPKLYAYGTLPMNLTRLVHQLISIVFPMLEHDNYCLIIGRLLSATCGTLTVFYTYLIGKKLYNEKVALLASLLLALSVLHIQNSHFFTVDIWLTLFVTGTLYYLINIFRGTGTTKDYILTSIFIGCALAVKVSAGPLVIIFLICHLINSYKQKQLFKLHPHLLFFAYGVIALAVNFIAQPIAYLKIGAYLDVVFDQIRVIKQAAVCYTQQYEGSLYVIYYVQELVYHAMGPPLAILCLTSFVCTIIITMLHPIKSKHTLLLLWAVPYFLTINGFTAKFLRYLLPLFPLFCLFGSYFFLKLTVYLQTTKTKKAFAGILWVILIGYTSFYSLAFFSIYMKPHTFVEGSKWFHLNVPENSIVLSQHWDEGFPLHTQTSNLRKYDIRRLELYNRFRSKTEDSEKSHYLAQNLEKGDYIVAQTKRLYGAAYNVKDRYPITSKYFDLLFTGRLGYKLIKTFTSRPALLGIEINDDIADESFSVYDHPKVMIFKKVQPKKRIDYIKLLEEDSPKVLNKTELHTFDIKDPTKTTTYSNIDEILLIVYWLIVLELLGVIGFALGYRLLKNTSGSKIFFSSLIGTLTFTYICWLLSSLSFIKYSAGYIHIVFIGAFAISLTYLLSEKDNLINWCKKNIDTILIAKLGFILCFFIFLALRSLSPEIFWGEKPMDYAFLNNLIHINSLPAQEIWFSGHHLNYYYFGQFIFATLAKLTYIPAFFVYNLSIATIAAFAFSGACGIAYMLSKNYLISILTGISTMFLGNLSGIRELLYSDNEVNFHMFWATSRVIPHTVNEYPLWGLLFGDLHAHIVAMPVFIFLIYLCCYLFVTLSKTKDLPWHLFALCGFTAGTLAVTNSWDLPGSLALLLFTLIFSVILNFKDNNKPKKILKYSLFYIGSIILSYTLYLPYWFFNKKPSELNIGFMTAADKVDINDYIMVWGLLLFIICIFNLYHIYKKLKENQKSERKNHIPELIMVLILTLFVYSYTLSSIYFSALATIIGIITFFCIQDKYLRFISALTTFGISITFFTQVIFIYDRMNTIFKFYLEAWYILSTLVIILFFQLFYLCYKSFKEKQINKSLISFIFLGITAFLVLLAGLTAGIAITGFSTTDHTHGYKPIFTINGLEYAKHRSPSEYKAFTWINNNIKNTDAVILEAHGHPYGEFSRVVMNTGIPTVVGWEHHLTQRAIPREEIHNRIEDVKTIYKSKNVNKAYDLLKKYRVSHVYIGPIEIKEYGLKGLKKFKENTDKFKPVYSDKEVTIYEVL